MGSENNITKHRGLYGFEQLGDGDPRRTVARNKWEIKALWQRSHEIIDRAIMKVCDSPNLRCLFLDNFFSESDARLCFLKDSHWNPQGHKKIGIILAKEISSMFPAH